MTSAKLRTVLLIAALLSTAPFAAAGYGTGNARLEKLYGNFISPCCWRENLTIHDSPVAQELRTRISTMVQAGRSDDEIKSALVAQYSKRVLALPEGSERIWLFWVPLVASAVGLGGILLLLRRLLIRSRAGTIAVLPEEVLAAASLEDEWTEA
ncbi:MAG: cytochrome c-type biogenesis protein CcmH [Nitrospirota bacterium]